MDPRHLQGDMSPLLGSTPGSWQMRHTGMDMVEEDWDRRHESGPRSGPRSSPAIILAPEGTEGKDGWRNPPPPPPEAAAAAASPAAAAAAAAAETEEKFESSEAVDRLVRPFLGRSFCLESFFLKKK